ncbi:MAG: hypothetical protein IPP17_24020 [Bacteroidetes bacterium]|nr:hypothetical protein [Bacteroidota bacterium]
MENADGLFDSQEIRNGLMSVLRTGYTMGSGHPFQDDPDSAILGHFDPDNSDLDPAYYSSCGGDPDCEDTLRHFYTRGAYLTAKIGLQIRLMEDSLGCPYYQDVHTIVHKPAMSAFAMEDIGGYNSFVTAGECNVACAANVALWVAELTDSCPALDEQDSLALIDALFDYCMGTCQDGNPSGLLMDEAITSGDLAAVVAILGGSCDQFLDSIAVPDPYIYTDSLGDTLKTLCTFWDPCFTALVDVINENWAYGAWPGQIAIADYPVLQWCYPGDSLIVVTDTSVVLVDTNNAVSCQVLYLVDANGTAIAMDSVKFLRVPELNVNPVGLNQSFVLGGETFDYQHIELEVTLMTADSTDSLVQGFVYSSCDSFLVWQDSCLAPQMPLDSGLAAGGQSRGDARQLRCSLGGNCDAECDQCLPEPIQCVYQWAVAVLVAGLLLFAVPGDFRGAALADVLPIHAVLLRSGGDTGADGSARGGGVAGRCCGQPLGGGVCGPCGGYQRAPAAHTLYLQYLATDAQCQNARQGADANVVQQQGSGAAEPRCAAGGGQRLRLCAV